MVSSVLLVGVGTTTSLTGVCGDCNTTCTTDLRDCPYNAMVLISPSTPTREERLAERLKETLIEPLKYETEEFVHEKQIYEPPNRLKLKIKNDISVMAKISRQKAFMCCMQRRGM